MTIRYHAEHLWNGTDGHGLVSPGIVDVADGRVAWVGHAESAPETDLSDRIDLEGLLMPGFVNVHCHTPMVLLRGAGEGLPVDRWLSEVIWPREARLTPTDVYWGMSLGAAELLLNGVTTSVEMYFHAEEIARAASDAGIRCTVTAPVIEEAELDRFGTVEEQLAATIDLAGRLRDSDLVDVGIGPHAMYTLSDGALRAVARVAAEQNLLVHIHVAEQSFEVDFCLERTGLPLVEYLETTGLFASRVLVAHGVWLTEEDRERLTRHAAGVAHCPASNSRHASGIAPIVELLELGVPVGLGTDGPASHSRLDMFEEMRLALRLARLRESDAQALSPTDALTIATAGGAAALGRTDIGSLEPGKWADMVNVATDAPAFTPALEDADLLTHLVWSAGPADVRGVWVGGRQVVDAGRCLTVDVERARAEAGVRARRIATG